MSERDEFEAWYMAPNGVRNTGLEEPLARDGSNYYWPSTQDSWEVWQAARAPQSVPALTDEQKEAITSAIETVIVHGGIDWEGIANTLRDLRDAAPQPSPEPKEPR